MLRYGLAGAIQRPRYLASRVSGSSSIASVGTHSKRSPRWSRAVFVNRCVRFFGLKSPTIPITALTPDTMVAHARHDPGPPAVRERACSTFPSSSWEQVLQGVLGRRGVRVGRWAVVTERPAQPTW